MSEYTADELREVADQTWSEFSGRSGFLYDNYVRGLLKTGADAMDALAKAEARVKVLEEALRWYGSHVYNCNNYTNIGDVARDALAKDGGAKARAALQVKPKPDVTGTGWKLSDEAKKDIAEIERHAKFYR